MIDNPVSSEIPILKIDIDRELVPTNLVHETAWAAIARDRYAFWRLGQATLAGRAALRRALAAEGAPEIERLPYNAAILNEIRQWRDNGGRVVLFTAFDRNIAEAVANELGIFDEVRLEARPAGHHSAIRTMDRARIHALLRSLRPHQWLKNVLVFFPILAAHRLDAATLVGAFAAFAAFCLIASGVYVLNDLFDLDSDRRHPRKRDRPFASGALSLDFGAVLIPGLLLAGFAISTLIGGVFLTVMTIYLVITSAYSFDLKRRLVVDISTLAILYTSRIIAGGVATDTLPSMWLLAFSVFFFFSLAAVKRQAELISMPKKRNDKAHGRNYERADLPLVSQMAIASGYMSVLVMALYLNSDTVHQLYSRPEILWCICLVLLYWISRLVMLTHRGWMHDDPLVFTARDRISQICAALILALAVFGAI